MTTEYKGWTIDWCPNSHAYSAIGPNYEPTWLGEEGGWLDGERILSPALIAEASRERIHGQDLVLPFVMSWGAGFMRNSAVKVWGPGEQTFGHSGWGGSCAFADPETGLAGAYVMNKQSTDLIGDARAKRLIEAAYAAL